MLRMLSVLIFLSGLLLAAPTLHAQAKAYAPENLRELSYEDQARVIGLEYSEQSRGRRIPDDQLRFYIDQVNRSDWGFSRIKQDIATSLGGGRQGGWNADDRPLPGYGGTVVCESDGGYRACTTGFRGEAMLLENLSRTRCVEGSNWGNRGGAIWVTLGCRGRFGPARDGGTWRGGNSNAALRCESWDNDREDCDTGFRGRAVIDRQLSRAPCIEGRTWGQDRDSIWVSGGCRADFVESSGGWNRGDAGYGADEDYTVTCSSSSGRRSTCAWNDRYGAPVLVQRLSSGACREGDSWGYYRGTIWVDQGCRARFGVR
ncbi:MAG TPA: DUF3011 domain-containing protein [Pseudoxanthomonas sp.]|nr:DUF3011 domain-containing protein [Pseudoxanthomonas sp.]